MSLQAFDFMITDFKLGLELIEGKGFINNV